ncbi:hypothetical protein AB0A05_27330 [Streptomyces sp. NPDC046374]|uniref:hypothetical protein n=1 Tax=Streptomyces sp. NPDC046374 TaxID=3154917 RepID=UPI0033C760E4
MSYVEAHGDHVHSSIPGGGYRCHRAAGHCPGAVLAPARQDAADLAPGDFLGAIRAAVEQLRTDHLRRRTEPPTELDPYTAARLMLWQHGITAPGAVAAYFPGLNPQEPAPPSPIRPVPSRP